MWAVARYDLGLSWGELQEMTPSMFRALHARHGVRLKHERFANAITAAAVYNSRRTSDEQPMISAYDFVRDAKDSKKRDETATLKRQIKDAVGHAPDHWSREKFLKMRANIVNQLTELGRTDAAELWAECWPDLVPREGE